MQTGPTGCVQGILHDQMLLEAEERELAKDAVPAESNCQAEVRVIQLDSDLRGNFP
ncbi:MAG TPA: hypothetical protein VLT62_21375 [Candidatus Methylomirabilis sp.]|nr:hypothetical protein [Candidatus Methylomirabilis sp.]